MTADRSQWSAVPTVTMKPKILLLTLLLANLLLTVAACTAKPAEKTPLNIIIAGSLMIPFDQLSKAYEAE